MRTAAIYNFLLEANLMAGIAILLMIVIRKFLRKPLGNRLIYFLWLLIAIRLLCPLALANPVIHEIRPAYLQDEAIRPIAGQIKVRLTDAADTIESLTYGNQSSIVYQSANGIVNGMYNGTLAKTAIWLYMFGVGIVLLFLGVANVRYHRKLTANRIEPISGKLEEQYLAICKQRGVKPIPVWFVDPIPSACLAGVFHPYIVLPVSAPRQEAVHMLTHEVCHYKGRDHFVSVIRLLCCVVHWFNPLVWLAAYVSRTDGELACDSRVVQGLSVQDRLHYTNTLVLAAAKRYTPGMGVLATGMTMTGKKLRRRVRSILNGGHTVKWLTVTVSLLACAALALTFFTAEHRAFPKMPFLSAGAASIAEYPLQSEDDAIRFAETFFSEGTLALDLADWRWSAEKSGSEYEIQAFPDPGMMDIPITMTLLDNGTVLAFTIPSDADRAHAVSYLYSDNEAKRQEVADYILRFWEANQPVIANAIDALTFVSEGAAGDAHFVSFYGSSSMSETAYSITVQVLPKVQIIQFRTNSEVRSLLTAQEIPSLEAVLAPDAFISKINGLWAMNQSMSMSDSRYATPTTDDAMPIADALTSAMRAITETYGEKNLTRFYVEYSFASAAMPGDAYAVPNWQLLFRNAADSGDHYDVIVNALNGGILFMVGPGEGQG